MSSEAVTLQVNGRTRTVTAAPWQTLLEMLRDELGLTGAKRGCNQGVCGACTVLVDGEPVRGCLSLAIDCGGRSVITVEGLSAGNALTPLQQAFAANGAIQCGFCTAGMLLAAHAFLQRNAEAGVDDVRAALSGNLCRCTGYKKVVEAVLMVAQGGAR